MPKFLLSTLEEISDGQRWRHMLDLGRRSRSDATARRDIAALAAAQNFYPRKLALMASYASGDAKLILACLSGSSSQLATLALAAAAQHVDDAALSTVLPELTAHRRLLLARACVARRRTGVVEDAFDRLGANDRAALLAYAGGDFVAAQLGDAEFAASLAPYDWARIARRHPAVAEAALTTLLERQDEAPHYLIESVNYALARSAAVSPPAALSLLHKAAARAPLGAFSCRKLASLYPREIAALILLDRSEVAPPIPRPLLQRVDDETRKALLRLRGKGVFPLEFGALDPQARRRLYEAGLLEPARDETGALPTDFVARLSQAARHAEARRAWAAPQLAAYPEKRLPHLGLLPFEEALREAKACSSQPDGDLRAVANAAIIASGRYEPAKLPEILAFCEAKKNEQDPVRLAMMTALVGLRPTRWREEHLPGISAVIDAALAARDCSEQTLFAAAGLLMRIAPQHIDYVARELTRLTEKLGRVPQANLQDRLTDAQMATLTPHILPLLKIWRARSYSGAIFQFLCSFGRRLEAAPPLLAFLVEMTADTRQQVASPALDMLFFARAKTILDALIPKLLHADPSWILSRDVAGFLHRRRQDLLGNHLRPRVYKGRFSTYKTAVVPPFHNGFHRWTQDQQDVYAQSLLSIANSGKRSAWELRSAIATLAKMPAADAAPIERLAGLDTKDVALRDMALTAHGCLDGGRGGRILTEALADERARIAIYALRLTVLDMPAAQAVAFLRRAPLQKVTVAKEVARLAGDVGGEDSYRFLAEFIGKPDLHRDVRIAVLRGLWSYLEREDTWELFAQAARGEDPAMARSTVRIPQERLSSRSRVRLAQHMALLLRHPAPQVRLDTLKRLVAMPISAEGSALAVELRQLLARPTDEAVRLAAAALTFSVARDATGALAATFAKAPTSRALLAIVSALIGENILRGARVKPAAEALVDLLLNERRHIGLAMRLAVHTLPGATLEAIVHRLSADGALHVGALMEALTTAPVVARQRRGAELDALESVLASMTDSSARRIGLGALVARAEALGWS